MTLIDLSGLAFYDRAAAPEVVAGNKAAPLITPAPTVQPALIQLNTPSTPINIAGLKLRESLLSGQRQPSDHAKSGGASRRGSHRMAQSAECPRAWFFRWLRRLEKWNYATGASDEPDYFRQGSLIHICLAYYYAGMMANPPDWYKAIPFETALYEAGKGYPDDVALARAALTMYHQRADNSGMVPIAVEYEFEATLGEIEQLLNPQHVIGSKPGDEQTITARIDLLAMINGKLWIIDYKTAGGNKGKGQYLPRWKDDGEYAIKWQLLVQALILRVALGGHDAVQGCVIQRIKRIPPFDVDRNAVLLPQQPYLDAIDTIRMQCLKEVALVERYNAAMAAGKSIDEWWPEGHFWSCFSYGRACDYRPICLSTSIDHRKWIVANEYKVIGT